MKPKKIVMMAKENSNHIEIDKENSNHIEIDIQDVEGSWKYYLAIIIFSNIAIWFITILFLNRAPRLYTSQWTSIVASNSSNTNVDLPGIGNTTSQQNSPYSDKIQDPRENYKFLAESEFVLKTAAASLKMSMTEFGRPRVKIIDNSTLLNFEVTGDSPKEAKSKASALNRALEWNLNRLRKGEMRRQEETFQQGLAKSREKLDFAQKRLLAYKLNSGLVVNEQVTQLSDSIENLRNQRAIAISQWRQASAQLSELSKNINLSSGQAANAFVLQADAQFQQNLKDYSDASSNLNIINAQFGSIHPAVINEKAKRDAARSAVLARSKSLLGESISLKDLVHLNLKSSAATVGSAPREDLFKQVITTQVSQQGYVRQSQELGQQISQLENRLTSLGQKASKLSELEREVKVSEAVFTSTLARLDIGKIDPLSAYPNIQTFAEPSLPETPSSPKTQFILFGATLSSILITTGLILLWRRDRRNSMNKVSEPLPIKPHSIDIRNSLFENKSTSKESLVFPMLSSLNSYSKNESFDNKKTRKRLYSQFTDRNIQSSDSE
jgi:uncharacterized protein involved in exopolysaccharide biosynthesis